MGKSLRIGILGNYVGKFLNYPLASCSLRNFDFLLMHTTHFHKSIILPFSVFTTLGFFPFVFFLHFKDQENIVLYIV